MGELPVRDDFAFPALTSTFLWINAFLDASGMLFTAVDESQPASDATLMLDRQTEQHDEDCLAGLLAPRFASSIARS